MIGPHSTNKRADCNGGDDHTRRASLVMCAIEDGGRTGPINQQATSNKAYHHQTAIRVSTRRVMK